MPIKLTDDELNAVMSAARPLDVRVRDAFLQQVASELARCDVVGPGVVHRICATTQRVLRCAGRRPRHGVEIKSGT